MSAGEILLWIILPYVAMTTFVVGLWWRYRADQFGWTSGSTQMFEHKILGWAGPAFHYGALAAIGGHVIGLMIPKSFTEAIGMSESTYRWFSAIAGAVAGAVVIVGFLGLVYRRITNVRVRRTTSRTDLFVYFLLVVLIGLGCWLTFAHNLITATPYDYRDSISEWWRSLFILQPDVESAHEANTLYQIHAITAWAFWALFPFSRLVHAFSIPLQYLGRPYILYRRRYPVR
jgi:nitrate reductase gamma subunit